MRLVYVKGQRGPEPQKWPDDMPLPVFAASEREVLADIKVARGFENYSINRLSEMYPYEERK